MAKVWNAELSKVFKIILTFSVVFIALLCIGVQAMADEGGYTITDYEFHGVLHENNVMDVTEDITVNFTEPRHGIYRYINTYYSLYRDASPTGDGSNVRKMSYFATVKDLNVVGAKFSIDSSNTDSRTYCVQIGDEDELVTGEKKYEITYRYVMRNDRVSNSDFFFYSVLGDGWETNINSFSFVIDFDKEFPGSSVDAFKVYSGTYGNESNDLDVQYEITKNNVHGQAENVGANQAISLYTELPEGYFVNEEDTNSKVFTVCIIPAVLFAIILLILELVKKDKSPVVTVEFYPPEGVSPAEIGTIVDESMDDRDFLALIPYWADQGYLLIRNEGSQGSSSSITISKKKELASDAPDYQKTLFAAMFKNGDSVKLYNLGQDFVKAIDSSMSNMWKNYFKGDHRLSKGGWLAAIFCLLDCILYGVALACASRLDISENFLGGYSTAFALAGVCIYQLLYANKYRTMSKKKKITSGIIVFILILIAFIFNTLVCAGPDSFLSTSFSVLIFVPVAAAMLFSGNLIHSTEYKRSMYGKILGFRQFIQTAEMPRLKILTNEDPEYYYHVLPYAMAFDLSDQWTQLFKDLNLTRPSWYYSNNTVFDTILFNRCLVDGIQNNISVTRSSMSSSSSSGGGFSGGGGGGGGGGSW